jgi:predicted amino acid-binding ACT domain protein
MIRPVTEDEVAEMLARMNTEMAVVQQQAFQQLLNLVVEEVRSATKELRLEITALRHELEYRLSRGY